MINTLYIIYYKKEQSSQHFTVTRLQTPVHSHWGLTSVFEGTSHTMMASHSSTLAWKIPWME